MVRLPADSSSASVELDASNFHQCVRLGRFATDRTISFVPPDGDFELMRYRTVESIQLPFRVHTLVNEVGKTRVDYKIVIRATFGSRLAASDVVLNIPTPPNTAKAACRVSPGGGKARFKAGENCIVWKIGRFQGQAEYTFTASADLTATVRPSPGMLGPFPLLPPPVAFEAPQY